MKCAAIIVALTGCTIASKSRVVYREQATNFQVRHNEGILGKRGEPGEIHPAVLEYVLSTAEGPLVAYYDLLLELPQAPVRAATDLRQFAPTAAQLAGNRSPAGKDYARAVARHVLPQLNVALKHGPQKSGKPIDGSLLSTNPSPSFGGTFEGTAGLWWGLPADLDANVLLPEYAYDYGETALRTVIYRYASLGLVAIRSSGTTRVYIWDVSSVPNAFQPAAPLDIATVTKHIVPLHTFTATPARSR